MSIRCLSASLWIVQGLLALTFVGGGTWKLATPIPQLAGMIPWAGEVSPVLLYTTAAFDILGGLGLLLPSVTRIKPELTVLAALGCVALQVSAVVFHFSRGETADTPFNFLPIALLLFVTTGSTIWLAFERRGHNAMRRCSALGIALLFLGFAPCLPRAASLAVRHPYRAPGSIWGRRSKAPITPRA